MKKEYPDEPKRNFCILSFNIGELIPHIGDCFTVDNHIYEVKHVDYNYDARKIEVRGYCNYWGTDIDKY